ncbi:MAG: hypothetical protein ACOZAN_03985 [Patescibacteria group bacterium]
MPQYLQQLRDHGNLDEALLKVHMASHDSVVADLREKMFIPGTSEEQRQKVLGYARTQAQQESKKNISEYMPIILNQVLVSFCSILDLFLTESFRTVSIKEPKILYSIDAAKKINTRDVFESTSLEDVVEKIRLDLVSKFDFMGIKDKLLIFSEKLGVDVKYAEGLQWHNAEIQSKYADKSDYLLEIYGKRNLIVHQDQLIINTVEELSEISEYISYFILDLGLVLGKHFKLETDFQNFLNQRPPGIALQQDEMPTVK